MGKARRRLRAIRIPASVSRSSRRACRRNPPGQYATCTAWGLRMRTGDSDLPVCGTPYIRHSCAKLLRGQGRTNPSPAYKHISKVFFFGCAPVIAPNCERGSAWEELYAMSPRAYVPLIISYQSTYVLYRVEGIYVDYNCGAA